MATQASHTPGFLRVGGSQALDFCNTVDERPGFRTSRTVHPTGDLFSTYSDLLCWSVESGILPRPSAEKLSASAVTFPQLAERALTRARALREQLFALFSPLAQNRAAEPQSIEGLNALLRTLPARQIARSGKKWSWEWRLEEGNLECMLPPIIYDAAEILSDSPLERLKLCTDQDCSWIFLDTSKNGRRRWCEMAVCGNREKVRKFYLKHSDRTA